MRIAQCKIKPAWDIFAWKFSTKIKEKGILLDNLFDLNFEKEAEFSFTRI